MTPGALTKLLYEAKALQRGSDPHLLLWSVRTEDPAFLFVCLQKNGDVIVERGSQYHPMKSAHF
jgi:hypothetical protein